MSSLESFDPLKLFTPNIAYAHTFLLELLDVLMMK